MYHGEKENYETFERNRKKKDEKAKCRQEIKARLNEDKLCSWLRQSETNNHSWQLNYHLEDLDDGRQMVDVVGEPALHNYLVCIELEINTTTRALDNVVKLWRYVEGTVNFKPILIIQIFSPRFDQDDTGRRRRSEATFVGERAQKDTNGKLTYKYFKDYWPRGEETKPDKLIEEIHSLIRNYAGVDGTLVHFC